MKFRKNTDDPDDSGGRYYVDRVYLISSSDPLQKILDAGSLKGWEVFKIIETVNNGILVVWDRIKSESD